MLVFQMEDMMSRCLLVSNRLPLTYDEKINGFVPSSGGLVSAIKGLDAGRVGCDFEWLGILTDDVSPERINEASRTPVGNLKCTPIVVPKNIYHHYYNGYSNNVIWPLFHYERSMVLHSDQGWKNYIEANQIVADAILKTAKEEDSIWIHDFHFMLVPGMVKEKNPKLHVGFFLHIPFPSSEIFRELPQRKEILESLVQCDLIGFHDLSYLNHFKSSLQRILGHNPMQERALGVYPISIDTPHFESLAKEQKTLDYIKEMSANKKDQKWVLGVDRLDYIKGLILKLRAFKRFLRDNPDQRGKVKLIQIVIPSRTEVPEYQKLKSRIEQLVSNVNGEYGTPTYTPITYMYHSVNENELSALYQLSEVMFITSRRDGMNLVSLEYVVTQQDKYPGSVLLSEFAGAHSTLSYAISINPWNMQETAERLMVALSEPLSKRQEEMGAMKQFLTRYTSSEWARIFLRDLCRSRVDQERSMEIPKSGTFLWMNEIRNKNVTFFCDLDGTLAPISAFPQEVKLNQKTIELLKNISETKCEFVVVSGRDKEFLEDQFLKNGFKFPLAACHGAYSYSPTDEQWHDQVVQDPMKWKSTVIDIFKLYTSRTPGSFIEDKGHAITWHYRNSPEDFSEFLANKLFFELEGNLISQPVHVSRGKKVIEVKSVHANKGYFVQQYLKNADKKPDIVVAIGDDTTDEDMFEILQRRDDIDPYCIKVGQEKSLAHYSISDQKSVNLFLEKFLNSMVP